MRRRSEAKTPTHPNSGVSADDVPQSNATGAADEPVLPDQESGPASGVAGVRGDVLAGRRDQRKRCERSAGQVVKRARSRTREGMRPAVPGHGKGRLGQLSRSGFVWFARGAVFIVAYADC